MRWRLAIVFAALSVACPAQDTVRQSQARAPRFSDYPFDQWAAAPDRSTIKWEVHLLPPRLSSQQRLIERVQAIVPGRELEKRRGSGELVMLARFEDSDGRQWRTGSRLNLANVQPGVKSQELTFTLAAFVRPGDYKVLIALFDSRTMEHNFTRRTLHVEPIKGDPLPDAWLGLPPVEVLPAIDDPDAWFLPDVKDHLHLPVGNDAKPVPHIELLVNMTPSERSSSMASSLRRNMSVVIPALKVLSGLNAKLQPPSAVVLDLTHHRVAFEASNAAELDWGALSRILTENHPGIIDAKSLASQSSMREYFAREIARRAGGSGPPRWLIVMSGPLTFSKQEESPLSELPADPNRHIVYFRFLSGFGGGGPRGGGGGAPPGPGPDVQIAPIARIHGPMPGLGTVLPIGPGRGSGRGTSDMIYPDDLERVLKPMGAQIVSVATPEAFRKLVAALIEEIAASR